MAVLTKRIDDMTKGKSEKGKKEKEKSEKEDEPSVGKADARSGQWVDITMKKVHRLLSMTDGDERKHVLDYTHVDLHYVEDQRKNLVVVKVSRYQLGDVDAQQGYWVTWLSVYAHYIVAVSLMLLCLGPNFRRCQVQVNAA
ncbi:hypothetical protein Tco_0896954 [Tanacetum coccineum]